LYFLTPDYLKTPVLAELGDPALQAGLYKNEKSLCCYSPEKVSGHKDAKKENRSYWGIDAIDF
jgi:hypothetical protein